MLLMQSSLKILIVIRLRSKSAWALYYYNLQARNSRSRKWAMLIKDALFLIYNPTILYEVSFG